VSGGLWNMQKLVKPLELFWTSRLYAVMASFFLPFPEWGVRLSAGRGGDQSGQSGH
jgi:hypothetical protein